MDTSTSTNISVPGFKAALEHVGKLPPTGVPITKRKPTRYEIHRRIEGAYPAWEQLEVVNAPSARAALRLYAADHSLEASDELNVTLRAIPISRITQVRVAVEQRSTLTFS